MRISKKVDPAVADLLTRAARTGLTDQQLHERAELSSGWLSQARKGRYGPGAASVKQLRRFLERFERGEEAAEEPRAAAEPERAIAPEAERSAEEAAELAKLEAELSNSIRDAKTAKKCGVILTNIASLVAADKFRDLKKADMLERLIARKVRVLKEERAERAERRVRALEILTPDEAAALEAYRASMRPQPYEPGEYVKPPVIAAKESP